MRPGTNSEQVIQADEKKLRIIEKATYVDQKMIESKSLPSILAVTFRRQFLSYYFTVPPLWKIILRAIISRKRMTPDFASLGAVRSGTTLLSDYIMQHPSVVLPLAKEVGVRKFPTKRMMLAQFPTVKEKKKVEKKYGKAITGYCAPVMPGLTFPYFASALTTEAKVIIIMRNPVDRTFSHWRWDQLLLSRFKKDPLWANYPDFSEVVRLEIDAIRSGTGSGFAFTGANVGGYVHHSIYLPFLKTLAKFVNKENIMYINASDFFADPVSVAKRIYDFLELPRYEPLKTPVKNAGPKAKMDEETRELLREFFKPYNQQLYEYIGQDFGWEEDTSSSQARTTVIMGAK